MKLEQNISLIGIMGCGKTSVGLLLAQNFDVDFFDLDMEIEKREQMSVSNIFATKGEEYFRSKETEIIKDIFLNRKSDKKFVLATGGGSFIKDENQKIINDNSLSIYLDTEPSIIIKRLENETSEIAKRPLLNNLVKQDNWQEKIKNLHKIRDPYYRKAQLTIHVTADDNITGLVQKILLLRNQIDILA